MKRLLWLGLLFISLSLLFFIPIFNVPDYGIGITFLIIGIIINTFGFWKHQFKKFDRKYLVMLVPLLLSIVFIPFPYSLGPIILTIATLIYGGLYFSDNQELNWVVLGIGFSGFVISVQTLLLPVYSVFISHGHRVDALSPIVVWVGKIFGLKTSVNSGVVFIQTFAHNYPVTTTWEKLGFYPWFNILIGALILFVFLSNFKKIGKYLLGFFLISGFYLILRFVIVLYVFTQLKAIPLFWDQIFLTISFIPFALLLLRFLPLKSLRLDLDCFKELKINKTRIIAVIFAFIFIFSLVGAFVFQDPGEEKQGRTLIDEFHSDWEATERPIDKEWYGMLSTYNYYSWAEWLDKYYEVERNLDQYLTYDLIKDYDILVLKCPTNLYEDQEITDIMRFVEEGGGLYFIGDHTNVFGMNFYLNQISENFGISFKTDSTYELGTGMTSSYVPDSLFPHVAVQNMEKFEFLTSCTLSAPINSENVMIGNRLLGEPGTYSTENFFRESRNALDVEYGLLLQVAALKYGKGRVLAFTDSTCFSNFCMFMDGYKDFNLGVMEYLNRENKYSYLNTVFVAVSIVSLLISLILLRKEKKAMVIYLLLITGMLAFSTAAPAFSYINSENYQLPSAHSDYPTVAFEQEYSNAKISHSPTLGFSGANNLFGTFFVWTQRVGYFASLYDTLEEAINEGDSIVIINPVKSFEDADVDAVKEYVQKGGTVLVMDSILNSDSTANELLQDFGVWLSYETTAYPLYNSSNGSLLADSNNTGIGNTTTPYLSIVGGTDTYMSQDNKTFITVVEEGKGKLVVVVDSYTFTDTILGGTFTEPDNVLRKIYDLEYYIFEELMMK